MNLSELSLTFSVVNLGPTVGPEIFCSDFFDGSPFTTLGPVSLVKDAREALETRYNNNGKKPKSKTQINTLKKHQRAKQIQD